MSAEVARKYVLDNHSTPLSTRALLLVLQTIESTVEVDEKPPSNKKAKWAEAKRKMESIASQIPKKARKGIVHWTKNTAASTKSLVGNVVGISAMCRPNTPRSHNFRDIWNVANNVTGPLG